MSNAFEVVDALTAIRRAAIKAGIDTPPELVFRTLSDRDQFLKVATEELQLAMNMRIVSPPGSGSVAQLGGIDITDRGASRV